MKTKHVSKGIKKDVSKGDSEERPIIKHHYKGLVSGYSFSHHSHGRVNYHSIGFNHEPGIF